jgi:drug/metabolite transporter (DMT)-like permease
MNAETPSSHRLSVVLLTLTALLWAGSFYAGKAAVNLAAPIEVSLVRFGIAGSILMLWLYYREGFGALRNPTFLRQVFVSGLFGVTLYNLFFYYGLRETSPVNGSLIVAANPAITALLSRFWKGETIRPLGWLGVLLSFAGVLTIVTRGSLDALLHLQLSVGDLMILVSSTCWAIYSILNRAAGANASSLAITAVSMALGAALFLPLLPLEPHPAPWLDSLEFWGAALYLAIFGSALAFVWWGRGVRDLGAPRAAIFINLVPVFAMLFAALLGQTPTPAQWAGAALILSGVYCTTRR